MSSIDPPAPRTPRVTIADLPTELKAHVARIARQQDQAYFKRLEAYVMQWEIDMMLEDTSAWFGRSLQALRLVDRAWSAVATEELFRSSVTAVRCHDDPEVSLEIVIRHASLVKDINLVGSSGGSSHILSVASLFTNLTSVSLGKAAFEILGLDIDLNTPRPPDTTLEQLARRAAYQNVLGVVHTVTLYNPSSSALKFVLAMASQLVSLAVEVDAEDPTPILVILGSRQVASRLNLHLNIGAASAPSPLPALAFDVGCTLQSLIITASSFFGDMSGWKFAGMHATALQRLDIKLWAPLGDDDRSHKAVFPSLRHLSLWGSAADAVTYLCKMEAPALYRLEVDAGVQNAEFLSPGAFVPVVTAATALLPSLPSSRALASTSRLQMTLSAFSLSRTALDRASDANNPYLPATVARELVNLGAENGVSLEAGPLFDTFFDAPYDPPFLSTTEAAADTSRNLDAVLRLAVDELDRAEVWGDWKRAEDVMRALAPVEELFRLEMD